jgi:hypothetical protein
MHTMHVFNYPELPSFPLKPCVISVKVWRCQYYVACNWVAQNPITRVVERAHGTFLIAPHTPSPMRLLSGVVENQAQALLWLVARCSSGFALRQRTFLKKYDNVAL